MLNSVKFFSCCCFICFAYPNVALAQTDPVPPSVRETFLNNYMYNPGELGVPLDCNCNDFGRPECGLETNLVLDGYYRGQCVTWVKYRTGYRKPGGGDAWTFAFDGTVPRCGEAAPGEDCWSDVPAAGAIMVFDRDLPDLYYYPYGHVAVVEVVLNNNTVILSEANRPTCQLRTDYEQDLGQVQVPYRFLYPNGAPVSLQLDCDTSPEINNISAVSQYADGSSTLVSLEMEGSVCEDKYHTLTRTVSFPASLSADFNFNGAEVDQSYEDVILGVDRCSEIDYYLQTYADEGRTQLEAASPIKTIINLPAPSNPDTTVTISNLGLVTLAMKISWDQICSNIEDILYDYECTCSIEGQNNYYEETTTSNESRELVLLSNTEYLCKVRARLGNSTSAWRQWTFVTPFTDSQINNSSDQIPTPLPPELSVDECQLTVSWTKVSNTVFDVDDLEYVVNIRNMRNDELYTFTTMAASITYPISRDSRYEVELAAREIADPSNQSVAARSEMVVDCTAEAPFITEVVANECKGEAIKWAFDPEVDVRDLPGLTGFSIFRRVGNGFFDFYLPLKTVGTLSYEYTDYSSPNGEEVSYKVAAIYNNHGTSALSAPQGVISSTPPRVPDVTSVTGSENTITIDFTDQSVDETAFIIESQESWIFGGLRELRSDTLPNATGTGTEFSYGHIMEDPENIWHVNFSVASIRDNCRAPKYTSPQYELVKVPTPEEVSVSAGASKLQLLWASNQSRTTYFEVDKKPSDIPGASWQTVKLPGGYGNKNWVDPDSDVDHNFSYRIRAVYDRGVVYYKSAEVAINYVAENCENKIQPASPDVKLDSVVMDQAYLSFKTQNNNTGFTVEYKQSALGWRTVPTINAKDQIDGYVRLKADFSSIADFSEAKDTVEVRFRSYQGEPGDRCYSHPTMGDVHFVRPIDVGKAVIENDTTVTLSWKSIAKDYVGYQIEYRNPLALDSRWVRWSGPKSDRYKFALFGKVAPGEIYYFRIRSSLAYHTTKAYSSWTTFGPLAVLSPVAPDNFVVTPADDMSNTRNLNFIWNDNSFNESMHVLQLSKYNYSAEVYETITDYQFKSAHEEAQTEGERIRNLYIHGAFGTGRFQMLLFAQNGLGTSDTVRVEYIFYATPPPPYYATSEFECAADIPAVVLQWQDRSNEDYNSETQFRIYRKLDTAEEYQLIDSIPPNEVTYIDKGSELFPLEQGMTYNYQVRAYSKYVDKESSSSLGNTTQHVPAETDVTGSLGLRVSTCQGIVKPYWQRMPDATGYKLEIYDDENKLIKTKFINDPLTYQTETEVYDNDYYRVFLYVEYDCFYSDPVVSNLFWAQPLPIDPPSDMNINATCGEIQVSWPPVERASYYYLYFWKDGELKSTRYTSGTKYTYSLSQEGNYQVKIKSRTSCGLGDQSIERNITAFICPPTEDASAKSTSTSRVREIQTETKGKPDDALIFPNPTTGIVNISINALNVTVKVFDFTGREVAVPVTHLSDDNLQLDFNETLNGIYYVSLIVNGNEIKKEMIVKE